MTRYWSTILTFLFALPIFTMMFDDGLSTAVGFSLVPTLLVYLIWKPTGKKADEA